MAFPDGWQRKVQLSLAGSVITGGPHATMNIRLTEQTVPEEMLTTGGEFACQADGGDIRLTTDEAGLNVLPLDIRNITQDTVVSGNQAFDAWSVVTEVESGVDVTLYLWYLTNETETQPAVGDTGGRNAVYPNHILAIAIDNDPGLARPQYVDRTGNGADCSAGASAVSGDRVSSKFVQGLQVDAAGKTIYNGTPGPMAFTIVVDIAPETRAGAIVLWSRKDVAATSGILWRLENSGGTNYQLTTTGATNVTVGRTGSGSVLVETGAGITWSDGNFHQTVVTADGSNLGRLFFDGAVVDVNITVGTGFSLAGPLTLGLGGDVFAFPGAISDSTIDEFEIIDNVAWSADYVTSRYAIMDAPENYITVGTPQSAAINAELALAECVEDTTAVLQNVAHPLQFTVDTVADVAGSLTSTYFTFVDAGGTEYYVWFDVAGTGVDPTPSGTPIEVDIASGATAEAVATALASAVAAPAAVASAVAIGSRVTITMTADGAPSAFPADVTTGFTMTLVQQGGDTSSIITDIEFTEGSAPALVYPVARPYQAQVVLLKPGQRPVQFRQVLSVAGSSIPAGALQIPDRNYRDPAGGGVSLKQPWREGFTRDVRAWDDALLLVAVHQYSAAGTTVTGVTYGGQAMTSVISVENTTGDRQRLHLWRLDAAGIAAATSDTIAVASTGTPIEERVVSAVYENVDQASPIVGNATARSNSGAALTTAARDVVAGGKIVGVYAAGENVDTVWPLFVERLDIAGEATQLSVADLGRSTATVSAQVTNTATVETVLLAASLRAA